MRKVICVKESRARFEAEEGVISDFPVSRVYGGIVPPDFPNPGYSLVLGEYRDADGRGKRPLYLLTEREEKTVSELFEKLGDDLARFGCQILFADEKQKGCWEALDKAMQHSPTSLLPAPYSEDIGYGKVLIHESRGVLTDIHGSVLARQLGELKEEDFNESLKDPLFYAVTALRFVLGAFKRFEDWVHTGRREVVSSGYPYV